MILLRKYLLACIFACVSIVPQTVDAQCHIVPIALDQRIADADVIVLAKAGNAASFWNTNHNNIYTSHPLKIFAVLKGDIGNAPISLITEGGIVGNVMQEVSASLEIDSSKTYIFLLKRSKITLANLLTFEGYGAVQGALPELNGAYMDPSFGQTIDQKSLFQKVESATGKKAINQDGSLYISGTKNVTQGNGRIAASAVITSVSPNPVISGTTDTDQLLIIKGLGFGTTIGIVQFSNADDGGNTLITSPVPSTDITYWTDTEIHIKVPSQAGTGKVVVNGTSFPNLVIKFAVLDINNTFSDFASSTRQDIRMVNQDNHGGYTFHYNPSFLQNNNAVASYERAIENWRCHTGMNYRVSGTITQIDSAANDNINVVSFGVLPAGVLGRATSWYGGERTNACDLSNTVWYTSEIDVIFSTALPNGYFWNYGPDASSVANTFDLESVALHEMGHAHGLAHIIASTRVMNYAISNGQDKRVLAAGDIEAGNYKLSKNSGYICLIPTNSTGVLIPVAANQCVLPSTILSISGVYDIDGNTVNWSTAFQNNVAFYSIWRSSNNGQSFDSLGTVTSHGSGLQYENYSFIDTTSNSDVVYKYHIFEKKTDGPRRTSDTISIAIQKNAYFDLYPTYVRSNDIMTIVPHNISAGELNVLIYDGMGKKVLEENLTLATHQRKLTFRLPVLQEGVYIYRIQKDDTDTKGRMLIKNQ